MSSQYTIALVDCERNVKSLANFNRENLQCYQKRLKKTRFRDQVTDEDMYTIWLVVSYDQMLKINNFCKLKNIKLPLCKEEN